MKKTADLRQRNLIGGKLRALRQAQKPPVSLEDLAGKLAARGIRLDRSAIGRIENGNRYVLDYELWAIAKSLRTSPGALLPP
jgi:transcriptional regulator with XRE-family HTH domain